MKIGIYERETTPFLGNSISGYFNSRYASDVKDKLYAKALVVDDGEDFFAMAAVDACAINPAFCDAVYRRVNKLIGIKRENLTISATHAHTSTPDMFEDHNKGENDFDAFYIDWLALAVADTVVSAYQARREGVIKYAEAEVTGISFVRNYLLKNGVVRTNPGRLNPEIIEPIATADELLPVLFFEDLNGEKLGLIYSFGCHQDCVETSQISGDYSSEVAKRLKAEYGAEYVGIYFCGTAGNVNDVDVKAEKSENPDVYREYGVKIADSIIKMYDKAEPIDGKISIAYTEKMYNSRVPTPKELAELEKVANSVEIPEGVTLDAASPVDIFNACMARLTINFAKGAPKYFTVKMQVIKLGKLMIFALPGEVFTHFGKRIREAFPENKCFFATLSNNAWSYMPPKECYLPELYESLYKSSRFYPEDVEEIFSTFITLGATI